ncbi:MAG: EamA family transporter [Solirubrobacterales bacterium]
MAAVLLALLTASSYGLSDFIGGIASKTRSAWAVAAANCLIAAVCTIAVSLFVTGNPRGEDFAWAVGGGVGEGVGIAFLYRGLSRGRMGVVAPIAGIGSALIPFLTGVATGEQLTLLSLVGVAIAFPALYLVPQREAAAIDGQGEGGFFEGVIAGIGFGAQFAFIGQIEAGAGLLPIGLLLLAATAAVIVSALLLRQPWLLRVDELRPSVACGLLNATAVVSFLLATQQGLLAIVSVIAALYPAITVGLAAFVLEEKIGRLQAVGMALTVIAVVLVTAG